MNFKEQAKELVSKMTIEEKLAQMSFDAPGIERLGVPAYNWWNECLHGLARSGVATVFPQSIAMASSYNKELMREVGNAISDEARGKYNEHRKKGYTGIYQGLTMCSPNINIFRDPRWTRGHETYGEDPMLTAMMATEYIKGLQGEGKYRKCDATLKHFAVHSGPENERLGFNAEVSEEDLYDTYLKAFKYCIENADPSCVMGAYNAVFGEPCIASTRLLTDILRNEFGFSGYIESDAGAVEFIHEHHKKTKDIVESAALSVNKGCDLCIGESYKHLPKAYEEGLIDEATVTASVERLFEARFRLGMFADDCEYDSIPYDVVDCEKHRELNLKMAEESIVLLKNNGILPLKKDTNVAVIGPNSDSLSVLLANYNGLPSRYSTMLRGISEKCEGRVRYSKGCALDKELETSQDWLIDDAVIVAQKSDVVIMCMGISPEIECEQGFGTGNRDSIGLPETQKKLYEAILATGKPIVFVNISGSCVAIGEQKNSADAVIQCFYPGARGGEALADIIFGDVSPSGRLPVTFYADDADLPDIREYSMKNRTYRFFEGNPVFKFGEGLTYSNIEEEWLDEKTVILKNAGEFDTKYSVLLFSDDKKELKDFKKVFIRKNETVKVVF